MSSTHTTCVRDCYHNVYIECELCHLKLCNISGDTYLIYKKKYMLVCEACKENPDRNFIILLLGDEQPSTQETKASCTKN